MQGGEELERRVLALDVEYAHFSDGSDAPAEVCLVEQGGGVVYHSFCNPGAALVQSADRFRVRCKVGAWTEVCALPREVKSVFSI